MIYNNYYDVYVSKEHRRKLMGRIPWNRVVKQKEVSRDGSSL